MNECANADIREMLPDLLHGNLPAAERNRVESHLAGCVECTGELGVLRTVRSAAVFAPAIDVNGIVRQIPPYQRITPVTERPVMNEPARVGDTPAISTNAGACDSAVITADCADTSTSCP